MEEITLRLAVPADVPRVMAILTEAHDAMEDPARYITDSEDYVARHVEAEGFILLAEAAGEPVGFFMTVLPGHIAGNTGYELTPAEDRGFTGVLDSVAVRPAWQGRGVMGLLLREAVRRLSGSCGLLVATVAPDNRPSLRAFEACGFRSLRTLVKPGGQVRLLMGLETGRSGDLP